MKDKERSSESVWGVFIGLQDKSPNRYTLVFPGNKSSVITKNQLMNTQQVVSNYKESVNEQSLKYNKNFKL